MTRAARNAITEAVEMVKLGHYNEHDGKTQIYWKKKLALKRTETKTKLCE